MPSMSSLQKQVERLREQVRVDNLPVARWCIEDWSAIINAFEAGAVQVTLHGTTIAQETWQRVLTLRQARESEKNATVCDQVADLAEARGDTSGLAGALREQAVEWRRKAGGASSSSAAVATG